ncbi:hypothetical protein HDU97_007203 [Phlyctochytrium planicorne]|nr:hypothetical protein HDU97_007203 [Phlyctochytrium planicorne]
MDSSDIALRLPAEILLISDQDYAFEKAKSFAGSIARFLPAYSWLYGSHAYDAIKDSFFEKNWPQDWVFLARERYNLDALIKISRGGFEDEWPDSLKNFVKTCGNLSLPRELHEDDYGSLFRDLQKDYDDSDTTKAGMTRKKLHEVERLSRVVLSVAKSSNASTIVDVGAGQGYLTHRLAKEYPVVALDFDEIQTVGSKYRGEMLKKRAFKKEHSKTEPTPEEDGKGITYVTEAFNYDRLMKLLETPPAELTKKEKQDGSGYTLVGLHACGDLSASTMLTAFKNNNQVRSIVVVPCCYNLLTEPEALSDSSGLYGFPLSNAVKSLCTENKITFGHRGRNLACQTFEKFSEQQMKSSVEGHYRRSLMDAILTDSGIKPQKESNEEGEQRFKIGKLPKEAYTDTVLYAVHAVAKLGLSDVISREQLEAFIHSPKYANAEKEVTTVFFVRSLLGRVIESLLTLDRFLFLHEIRKEMLTENINIRMLSLFDFRESPRNTVLIAEKTIK